MAREMKDSRVEWIGEIPREWEVGKVKNCFVRKNEKAKQENPIILSLARSGVKIRDISTGEGQIAESYFNYNPVEKGDLLINPMDLYSGANCSVSKVCGVISPAYINLKSINGNNSTYYDYYFKTQYWSMVFFAHGKGVSFDNRWTLNTETLFNYFIPIPPLEEQEKIVNYLNKKVSDIDLIIEKTKITIEDYKKYKQSIITEAVTKGLNPNVEMKDSEIEWIGEIPKEWKVVKGKNIFKERKMKGNENNLELLSPTQKFGVIPQRLYEKLTSLRAVKVEETKDLSTFKAIYIGDFCISLRSFQGGFEYSTYNGVVSPAYKVFYAKQHIIDSFYKYFFKEKGFISKIASYSCSLRDGKSISFNEFGETNIIYPPLEEQKQVADYLDKKTSEIDTLITKKENLIKELEEYKKSLIYECVTGKKEVTTNV